MNTRVTCICSTYLFIALAPAPTGEAAKNLNLGENPVGNGPFRLRELEGRRRAVLERNPEYYGEAARVDQVEVKIIEDLPAAVQELRDGKIDALIGIKFEDQALADQLRSEGAWELPEFITGNLVYISMNTEEAPWSNNIKLRQALNWAVDRERLAQERLRNRGEPADSVVPPIVPGHQANAMPYRYDPERARSLLAEAGYPGGQGLPPLTLQHLGEPMIAASAAAIKEQLGEIGITMALKEASQQELSRRDTRFNFFATSYTAVVPTADDFIYNLFDSKSIGRVSLSRYQSPEVDALIAQASAAGSFDEEIAAYNQAERKALADAPIIPLCFVKVILPHSRRVTSVMRDSYGEIPLNLVTVANS